MVMPLDTDTVPLHEAVPAGIITVSPFAAELTAAVTSASDALSALMVAAWMDNALKHRPSKIMASLLIILGAFFFEQLAGQTIKIMIFGTPLQFQAAQIRCPKMVRCAGTLPLKHWLRSAS